MGSDRPGTGASALKPELRCRLLESRPSTGSGKRRARGRDAPRTDETAAAHSPGRAGRRERPGRAWPRVRAPAGGSPAEGGAPAERAGATTAGLQGVPHRGRRGVPWSGRARHGPPKDEVEERLRPGTGEGPRSTARAPDSADLCEYPQASPAAAVGGERVAGGLVAKVPRANRLAGRPRLTASVTEVLLRERAAGRPRRSPSAGPSRSLVGYPRASGRRPAGGWRRSPAAIARTGFTGGSWVTPSPGAPRDAPMRV